MLDIFRREHLRELLSSPNTSPCPHLALHKRSVARQPLALQVIQKHANDSLVHKSVVGVAYIVLCHAIHGQNSLVDIPLPRVCFDKCGVVSCHAIQRPVGSLNRRRGFSKMHGDIHISAYSHMNVVICAGRVVRVCLIPRPPISPVDVRWIFVAGNERGLVKVHRLWNNQYRAKRAC